MSLGLIMKITYLKEEERINEEKKSSAKVLNSIPEFVIKEIKRAIERKQRNVESICIYDNGFFCGSFLNEYMYFNPQDRSLIIEKITDEFEKHGLYPATGGMYTTQLSQMYSYSPLN